MPAYREKGRERGKSFRIATIYGLIPTAIKLFIKRLNIKKGKRGKNPQLHRRLTIFLYTRVLPSLLTQQQYICLGMTGQNKKRSNFIAAKADQIWCCYTAPKYLKKYHSSKKMSHGKRSLILQEKASNQLESFYNKRLSVRRP